MALVRAYAVLTVKALNEEQRILEGIATTPATDRDEDIVDPFGAEFSLPLPFMWQHGKDPFVGPTPVGQVVAAKATSDGIPVRIQMERSDTPGRLKDILDFAWDALKKGLVRGLSIGSLPKEVEPIKGSIGLRFKRWEWLELSAVTIPANSEASIQLIKSCDTGLAATGVKGRSRVVNVHTPGDTGTARAKARTGTAMKKSIAQQISDFEATRQARAARMDEILEVSAEKGETLNPEQQDEYDGIDAELKSIDAHLVRLRAADERQKAAAVVVKGATEFEGAESRGGGVSVVRVGDVAMDKGIAFARYVSCKMAAFIEMHKGNFVTPLEIAKSRYPSHAALHAIFQKTAVAAGTTSASHAYDDLVPYQAIASDFIDYLRPKTIIDRLRQYGIRLVPFNIRVGGFSAGTTGYWKGEGKPIPVSKATSENVTLTWATAAGLTVTTQELMRFSTPSAEQALRDDLAGAVIARCDVDFVDPSKAAVANTSPASITNGVAATAPSGTAATNVRHDLAAVLQAVAQTLQTVSGVVLIMSDTMATAISMMVNALGQPEFPQMTPSGGSIVGIPVIVSEHLTSVGSPSTQTIVLCKPSEIYLADDGQVSVDASMEASVEMSDAPTQDGTTGGGASMVSLWQAGLIGIRVERVINWKLRRTHVQYISPAAYAVPTS